MIRAQTAAGKIPLVAVTAVLNLFIAHCSERFKFGSQLNQQ